MAMKRVTDDFEKTRQKMLSRASSFQGAAARIYKLYQRFQTERFKTENSSEGKTWKPLNKKYQDYKRSRFGGGPKRGGGQWKSWPGNGSKMLIATGTLAGAVIGPGAPFEGTNHHKAIFTSRSMTIYVDQSGTNAEGRPFRYAGYVNQDRPFMEFSDDHLNQMKDELMKYVIGE